MEDRQAIQNVSINQYGNGEVQGGGTDCRSIPKVRYNTTASTRLRLSVSSGIMMTVPNLSSRQSDKISFSCRGVVIILSRWCHDSEEYLHHVNYIPHT